MHLLGPRLRGLYLHYLDRLRSFGFGQRQTLAQNGPDVRRPHAEVAARHSLSLLLQPERAARLSADASPGLDEVIDSILNATWRAAPRKGREGAVQRAVVSGYQDYVLSLVQECLDAGAGTGHGTRPGGNNDLLESYDQV